jgi:L-ectoine synthase
MIVRKLTDVAHTDREIDTPNWVSRRLLLARDGMGFSVHDTIIRPGTSTRMEYRNHLEAVYCIEGRGSILDVGTGIRHPIEAGTIYALDKNDEHVLDADPDTHLRMVCVFNPPVAGDEVHDETGAYPAAGTAAAGEPSPS